MIFRLKIRARISGIPAKITRKTIKRSMLIGCFSPISSESVNKTINNGSKIGYPKKKRELQLAS